ncbi:hypothetical protein EI94DRAFT_1733578 [Lactarius quietus]|nr:hypothetical protein EI94DRAFT_1733578 [Lactarius quietus]
MIATQLRFVGACRCSIGPCAHPSMKQWAPHQPMCCHSPPHLWVTEGDLHRHSVTMGIVSAGVCCTVLSEHIHAREWYWEVGRRQCCAGCREWPASRRAQLLATCECTWHKHSILTLCTLALSPGHAGFGERAMCAWCPCRGMAWQGVHGQEGSRLKLASLHLQSRLP